MTDRLREILRVRQTSDKLRRRWWACARMDLYVWQNPAHEISAFEICYNKPHQERSLRWGAEHGFSHSAIDDGEATAFDQRTPIAVPSRDLRQADVAAHFEAAGADVEPYIYRRILSLLL
jgi:hypothetical protein